MTARGQRSESCFYKYLLNQDRKLPGNTPSIPKQGLRQWWCRKGWLPSLPCLFLINLSSIKKTDSKKMRKKEVSICFCYTDWKRQGRCGKAIPQIWTAGFHLAMEPIIFAFKQMCQTEGMEILHIFLAASRTCWEASYCLVCLTTSLLNINCIQKKNQPNDFALQGLTHWSLNPNSLLYTVLFATSKTRHHFCVCWHSALCSSFTTHSRFRTLPGPSSY